MIRVNLTDSRNSKELKISEDGVANVVVHQHPALEESIIGVPSVVSFADSDGVTDMRQEGTLDDPIIFSINASPNKDIYIKTVLVTIADAGSTLNQFGNIGDLDNGVNFCWESSDLGRFCIKENMISNWDFVKLGRFNPAYGSGNSSFRANNVVGNSEAFGILIDFSVLFGFQYGIRLRKGTFDRVSFEVRDDVTNVDEFTADATIVQF